MVDLLSVRRRAIARRMLVCGTSSNPDGLSTSTAGLRALAWHAGAARLCRCCGEPDSRSRRTMRPPGPVPVSSARSMDCSRVMRRTSGLMKAPRWRGGCASGGVARRGSVPADSSATSTSPAAPGRGGIDVVVTVAGLGEDGDGVAHRDLLAVDHQGAAEVPALRRRARRAPCRSRSRRASALGKGAPAWTVQPRSTASVAPASTAGMRRSSAISVIRLGAAEAWRCGGALRRSPRPGDGRAFQHPEIDGRPHRR